MPAQSRDLTCRCLSPSFLLFSSPRRADWTMKRGRFGESCRRQSHFSWGTPFLLQTSLRKLTFEGQLWGSKLSQFIKIHFQGVVLELLAPICKREKGGIPSHGLFLLEASLPALDGGVGRLSTEAFLLWLDLVCPLPTQVPHSSLQVLPPGLGEIHLG